MGMDVYSESGVVFPVEEIAARLFGKISKPKVLNAVAEIKEIFTVAKNEHGMSNFLAAENALGGLKVGGDIAEWFDNLMREMLTECCAEYYFSDNSILILDEIWCVLLDVAGLFLPPVTFKYWYRPRWNGWDVPFEKPCIVFDPDDLFETKLTQNGKKMAKLLKREKLRQTTWTRVSI